MYAAPGSRLIVETTHLNEHKRHGVIVEVHGANGSPPYLVRWDDTGTESVYVPGPGAHIIAPDNSEEPAPNS